MTDYDALSDEELAALVAERVMGWKLSPAKAWWCPPDFDAIAVQDWRPAISWADAGRVTEKIRENGWWCTIVCAPPRSDFGVMVVFAKGAVAARAQCPSDLRAICIAALRAVGA